MSSIDGTITDLEYRTQTRTQLTITGADQDYRINIRARVDEGLRGAQVSYQLRHLNGSIYQTLRAEEPGVASHANKLEETSNLYRTLKQKTSQTVRNAKKKPLVKDLVQLHAELTDRL